MSEWVSELVSEWVSELVSEWVSEWVREIDRVHVCVCAGASILQVNDEFCIVPHISTKSVNVSLLFTCTIVHKTVRYPTYYRSIYAFLLPHILTMLHLAYALCSTRTCTGLLCLCVYACGRVCVSLWVCATAHASLSNEAFLVLIGRLLAFTFPDWSASLDVFLYMNALHTYQNVGWRRRAW